MTKEIQIKNIRPQPFSLGVEPWLDNDGELIGVIVRKVMTRKEYEEKFPHRSHKSATLTRHNG